MRRGTSLLSRPLSGVRFFGCATVEDGSNICDRWPCAPPHTATCLPEPKATAACMPHQLPNNVDSWPASLSELASDAQHNEHRIHTDDHHLPRPPSPRPLPPLPFVSHATRYSCVPRHPFIHSKANLRDKRLGSLPRLLAELPCVLEELEPRA